MRSLIILLSASLLGACSDRTPPPPADQMIRSAKVMSIESVSSIQPVQLVGRVEAAQTVELSFQVGGPLAEMYVLEGTLIQQANLIAALEPADFNLAVRESEAQLRLASQDLGRKRRVLAENGIAQSAVDDAGTIQQLRQVQLEKAEKALADSKLYAPFDAYVAQRYVDNFTNVRPLEPIVRLHDLSELVIKTSIPESLLATVSPERMLTVTAHFDFLPNRAFPLAYRENQGDAEDMAQTYEISFTMKNPKEFNILPGMTARVNLQLSRKKENEVLAYLPTTAIVSDANNELSVWLVDQDSKRVSRQMITVGTPEGDRVPVTAGLVPGDMVVTAGASQLVGGMQIEPITRIDR